MPNEDAGEAVPQQLAGYLESPVHRDDVTNKKVMVDLKINRTIWRKQPI